ncbi:LPP20 family lipoprotein [Saccharospirillum mangrovi]|uniref:LPP20 family lipoprotein n=1 Tax=Saccharospirillum mangrovi TaxID=2161747 RepID=UPI00130040A1|nr:LPP20 family lipoprotein [Saccharospirillum mangrovi]
MQAKTMRQLISLATLSLLLSGCGMFGGGGPSQEEQVAAIVSEVRQINEKLPPMEPMVLRASGYGAINPNSAGLTEVQQRLIARRASKLDAYRTMAERVYGTQIIGTSTVEDMVVQSDRYRAFVDTQIMGARVIYQEMLSDGSYETMVEMVIDEGFRNCLATRANGRQNASCAADMIHDIDAITRSQLSRQGVESNESGLYFIE